MSQTFFYDGQIRRFLVQFTRMFSGFQVEFGPNQAGKGPLDTLVRVPIRYGDATRQVQTILQENSSNNMPATPLMTFYISDLSFDRPRMQNPTFVANTSVRQRTYDKNTGTYETTQGNAFTIERYMPAPYKLTIKLDIWTSNTNQKFQLWEQILPLINPSLEVQATDNFLDWTSLSIVELQSTGWSSRSIPMGTEDPIDISTLTFVLPIWLSLPAKVKKLGVVEKIIASVFDGGADMLNAVSGSDLLLGTRQVITPYNYRVVLIDNKLQALGPAAIVQPPNSSLNPPAPPNTNIMWTSVVALYGTLRPGISMVSLRQEDGSEVYGTVAYDPTDDRFLLFNVMPDTLPANTLRPLTAVIDPLASGPGVGLPPAIVGQRYLLTDDTGSDNGYAAAWAGIYGQPLIAHRNDVIEYNGEQWQVEFDSEQNTFAPDEPVPFGDPEIDNPGWQYITNINTEIQYKWTGAAWVKSYQGSYQGGDWTLIL
jgi:hypothetical protein